MNFTDFTYNEEEKFFLHEKSQFMLDAEFALLFEDERVLSIMTYGTGEKADIRTLTKLREIYQNVLDNAEKI
jgi:hypothetical protein